MITGEWRVDTQLRFGPDSRYVCIDAPHEDEGRQLHLCLPAFGNDFGRQRNIGRDDEITRLYQVPGDAGCSMNRPAIAATMAPVSAVSV